MFAKDSKLPGVGTTVFTVMSRRARELGAINLSQGFPDFSPPTELLACLRDAADGDVHQYAPMQGLDSLHEQALRCIEPLGCKGLSTNDITITLGATEALFSTIQALVRAGDEVIVFDPCYDAYVPAIELCGARAVRVPLSPPALHRVWQVDWQRVKEALSSRTRMVIVNTPHNPTGMIWSRSDMDTLAELLRDTGVIVLGDEVYAHMVFDGQQHHSLQAHPELRERSVSVFSFGKLLHATGWRVGFAVARAPSFIMELRKVHQFNTFSIAHPLQWAIAEFLRRCPDHPATVAGFYQRKRDDFLAALAGSRFSWTPSPATFFQLLDYSAISSLTDLEMTEVLLTQHGVAAIPLSPFCATSPSYRYLRFCFAKRDETLCEAGERLCRL
jgi:methionine transaminase